MHGFVSDIRYALQRLKHGGIPILVAVLSLAIGIGANTAMFSVDYAMLMHPLPYADADRLVMLRSTNPSHGVLWTTAAPANLLDWQVQAKSFEAIAGYRWRTVDLTSGERSERLRGLYITPAHAWQSDISEPRVHYDL
jgi:putative ABC transport system permease protein